MMTPIVHRSVMLNILFGVMLFLSSCSTSRSHEKENAAAIATLPSSNLSSVDFAYEEMMKAGITPAFGKVLQSQYIKEKNNTEMRDQIVQLNVLGFLAPGDYSKHYSASAVKHIRKFIQKYQNTLTRAENEFHVSKDIIAALLWVETKHGKTMGKYRLPVVYFALLQAKHPEVAKYTLAELNRRKPASNSAAANLSYPELQQKVITRSISKSNWALEQIKSLQMLSTAEHPKNFIFSAKASFAGAFGCSQFIPTSYEKYAVSASKKKVPNLFDLKDCIFSVANFLHKSGWDSNNPKTQSDALFEYNRIRDYGDVIQKLAAAAHEV